MTSVCLNNLGNSVQSVVEDSFLVLFLAIIADFFFLRPIVITIIVLIRFIKILWKNKSKMTEILKLYDKQRKI